MRYIIAAKGDLDIEHTSGSGGDLSKYFELGWEISTTHLTIKYLLSKGGFNDDDIIVTLGGRMFFYEKLFKKVIDWNNFLEIIKGLGLPMKNDLSCKSGDIEILDLVSDAFLNKGPGKVEKWNTNRNKIPDDILFSFNYVDLSNFDLQKKYVCMPYRKRLWGKWRNLDDDYYNLILQHVVNQGFNCFIVGFGGEKWSNDENIFHVDLQQWASLLNNGCKYAIGSMTGVLNLTYLCAKSSMTNIIIDLGNNFDPNNDVCMGETINFKKIKNIFFHGKPNIEELKKKIIA